MPDPVIDPAQQARDRAAAAHVDNPSGANVHSTHQGETVASQQAKAGLINAAMVAQARARQGFLNKQGEQHPRIAEESQLQKNARWHANERMNDYLALDERDRRAAQRRQLEQYSDPSRRFSYGAPASADALNRSGNYLERDLGDRAREYYNPMTGFVEDKLINEAAEAKKKQMAKARAEHSYLTRRGGAGNASLRKIEQDIDEKLQNRLADLRYRGYEDATKMAEQRAAREEANLYKNIGLQGELHGRDIEKELLAHRLLGDMDTQQLQNTMKSIQFQNLMGSLEQAQTQEELNAAWRDFAEKTNYDWDQLQKAMIIVQGLPTANSMSQTFSGPPQRTFIPPSLGMSSLMGILGAENMMGGRPFGGHAEGGSVRGYAEGGNVRDRLSAPQPGNPWDVPTEDLSQHPTILKGYRRAQELERTREPGYIPHVLQSMYANQLNYPENPREGFYKGIMPGIQTYRNARKEAVSQREQAFNLEAKIFDTLREEARARRAEHRENRSGDREDRKMLSDEGVKSLQKKVLLAKLSNIGKGGNSEKAHIVNGHQIIMDEQGRAHAIPLSGYNKPKTSTDIKTKKEMLLDLANSVKLKHDAKEAASINEKLNTGTYNKWANKVLGDTLSSKLSDVGTAENIQKFKQKTGDIFIRAHQGMKNIPRSMEFAKKIEDIKGSLGNERGANKAAFNDIYKNASLSEQVYLDTLKEMGMSEEEIANEIQKFEDIYEGQGEGLTDLQKQVAEKKAKMAGITPAKAKIMLQQGQNR